MRVKHLPPSEPSPSPSAPPRSGSTRRPVLAGVPLLVTLLLAAAPLEAQWVGVGFAASTFGTSFQTQSSLWFEVTPGFYGSWVSSGPTGGLVNYRHGVRGAQRGWRGHRGSDHHYGYGYWGNSCWDLLWDPWSSYWPGCPPTWAAGLWWPYQATAWGWQGYPSYPVHHAAYRPLGHHGWSIGVHLSFGSHWGADPYAWRPFDPWSYGWDRYAWYSPRPAWRTIYVDTRPRWVVSPTPRVVRAGLSPRIGSGGWVSQSQYKEDPRRAVTRVRTAVERPSRQSEPATRSALARQSTSRAAPQSRVAETRPVRRGAVARAEPERIAAETPTPETRTGRATASRRESVATGTRRPIVIRGSGSRNQASAAQSRASDVRRPTGQAATPSNRSTTRTGGQARAARSSNLRPTGQIRAPTRAAPQSTTRSRSSAIRSAPRATPSRSSANRSPSRATPSRSSVTRSSPQRANPSRPSSGRSRASAPAPQRSRPAAAPSRSGGRSARSSPAGVGRATVRR